MLASSSVLSVILLAAASVQPAHVPATGKKVATVRIDKAGMYHISARSEFGTACRLVDHQRGPFASSGVVGKKNCELDLLLDAGVYRLRLDSPKKAKGQVTLSVKQFAELFDRPVRLERGRSDHTNLAPGQQASWWVRINARRYVTLQVLGRTAGAVKLWRDGRWVEEIGSQRGQHFARKGQPLHAWTVQGWLEAGDYLLTVYGSEVQRWTEGREVNSLFVANGWPMGAVERSQTFILPDWGQVSFQVPKARLAAFLGLDKSPDSQVSLEVHQLKEKGDQIASMGGSCRMAPKVLIPLCSAFSGSNTRQLIVVKGAPGTTGQLRWADYLSSGRLADNYYTSSRTSIEFEAPGLGDFLVATDDVPVDPDAAPLACSLKPVRHVRYKRTHRDYLALGNGRVFERQFNYNGSSESIWFQMTGPGLVHISTGGERENRCELYELLGEKRERLTRTETDSKVCKLEKPLGAGHYQLNLYGGGPGIEKLTIRSLDKGGVALFGKSGKSSKTTKNSCRFGRVKLEGKGKYRVNLNRSGRVTARGLVLRELPLKLDHPLPLVVDAGESVKLPLAAGSAIEVRSVGSPAFSCALGGSATSVARDGVCRLAATGGKSQVLISNPGTESLVVSLVRPRPAKQLSALAKHDPKLRKLIGIKPGQVRYFDFDRKQSHSMTFDVKEAGLYHLATQGLLASECRVRTPIVPRLASAKGGGRGRNCLVAGYLRPGRYLMTATTTGSSRGRGGVKVIRRPVRKKPGIAGEGDSFFRVEADELVQQDLTVKQDGRYTLRTAGQGVALSCRLEDADGWPLVRVPTSCSQTLELEVGRYRWGQMPLTVESMRKTELRKVRPPEVLRGNSPHKVKPNRAYTAELGQDGKDDFLFDLQAEMDVFLSLSQGMQGRLFRLEQGKPDEVVDVIPPGYRAGAPTGSTGGAAHGDCDCEYEEECEEMCGQPRPGFRASIPTPAGKQLGLKPGAYKLTTEHPRGDVGIRYQVTVSTTILAPGLARAGLPVPGAVMVRMSEDGVLRIKSEGETDVRCRLFDRSGFLVTEGLDIGADWNCLTAVPVAAGDYRLVMEAENGISGSTRIAVDAPSVKEVGVLSNGQTLKTGNHVLLADLPEPKGNSIQEVGFRSKLRFSCTLEDKAGRELQRHLNVLRCGFLVNPKGERYRVRLWTRRWSGTLDVKMLDRKLERMKDGEIDSGEAALVEVPRTGLYETAKKVWCLPADQSGALRFCGPFASLEKGPVVFSTTGPDREPDLEMDEQVERLERPVVSKPRLTDQPNWQRQRSRKPSLHLLSLRLPHGEQAAPACRIDGGVHQQRGQACFAVSGPVEETLGRWWLTTDRPRRAKLERRAVVVPKQVAQLRPGVHNLVWSGPVARYRLPASASRIELVLPSGSWAVQVDAAGRAEDLCVPEDELNACVLGASGGELMLVSDSERRALARLLLVERPPGRETLKGLFERWTLAAGQTRLGVPPSKTDRLMEVRGASHCRLALDDGTRLSGCRQRLPAGTGGLLVVEHEAQPLQVVVAPSSEVAVVRWGAKLLPPGPAKPLLTAKTVRLSGALVSRSISVERPTMVHLHADAGVCSLVASDRVLEVAGHGLGCDIQRLLDPGTYLFKVRPFGGRPLSGTLSWTGEALRVLNEGVGLEDWLAPGQARTYRFKVAAEGKIGLGVRSPADLLACELTDPSQRVLGRGCQQFIKLNAGSYLLTVRVPENGRPMRYRPVILGLAGSKIQVPEAYLRNLFQRIGFEKNGGQR